MKQLITILAFLFPVICFGLELELTQANEKYETRRNRACEDWIPVAECQAQFDELVKEEGMFPIYTEQVDGKSRTLYIDKPDGFSFWTQFSLSEEALLQYHKQRVDEGYVLITLLERGGPNEKRYWATWVNEGREKKVMRQMKRFGLSQGSIRD